MTNLPKLSARAQKALNVLADGGAFVQRLERDSYTGREKWKYRLLTERHGVVRGVGLSAFYELRDAGFLAYANGYSTANYYKLQMGA